MRTVGEWTCISFHFSRRKLIDEDVYAERHSRALTRPACLSLCNVTELILASAWLCLCFNGRSFAFTSPVGMNLNGVLGGSVKWR